MRYNLGRLRVPAAALAAGALVVLGAGPAAASGHGNDPISTLLGQLQQQQQPAASGSTPAPAPSSDSDLPGHETQNPSAPDHGAAEVAKAAVGGKDLADVSKDNGTTRDDNGTSADSTLLAIGGQEILGAHADSTKTHESHAGDPLAPLCANSGGQVCLRVLFADAYATNDGSTSHSLARSGIASACLGGSSTDPNAACTGPVSAGVGNSSGESTRDQASGRTTASSQSDLANACLTQPGSTGGCSLGADVLHSDGRADSGGATPSASRSSYLAGVTANGQNQGRIDQPTAIAIQPACASPSLICAYLNQGETYLGSGMAGTAQDALDARVLPDTPVEVGANLSRSETLVHNNGGTAAAPGAGDRGPSAGDRGPQAGGGPRTPGGSSGGLGGVLPNTGGVWSGLLAAGLGAVGLGALVMAFNRRKALAAA